MKRVILLAFVVCSFQDLSAQYYFGNAISRSACKLNRVKGIKIYSFENETDSVLVRINTYDSFGNPLIYKTFSKRGILTGIDTYIYDKNHFLVKQINSDGDKRAAISFITNDEMGKEQRSETFINDSLVFHSIKKYDNDGRLVNSSSWNYKGDSIVTRSFYNKEGITIKTVSFDKRPDSSITIYEYDSLGNVSHKYKNDFDSKISTTYLYDHNGNCIEITSAGMIKNEKANGSEKFTYYLNGLTFENTQFKNNKVTGKYKAYYTYY